MTHPGQPGQPHPPQGQPFPPQGQPFPPQGQPFPPQGGPGGHGPFGTPPPAPAGKPGRGRKLGSIAGALAIAGGIAAFRLVDVGAPEVGDCIEQPGGSDVDTVDCADAAAGFRVVGIEEEELSESEYLADPNTCSDFASATDALWRQGSIGSDGTVYCLEPVA